jgi:hypothetical protein
METIIGINIETKTAREQELLAMERDAIDYYGCCYVGSITSHCEKVIRKFTDCAWHISKDSTILKSGTVRNVIIFKIYNIKGFNKKALRQELDKYLQAKFKRLFKIKYQSNK